MSTERTGKRKIQEVKKISKVSSVDPPISMSKPNDQHLFKLGVNANLGIEIDNDALDGNLNASSILKVPFNLLLKTASILPNLLALLKRFNHRND